MCSSVSTSARGNFALPQATDDSPASVVEVPAETVRHFPRRELWRSHHERRSQRAQRRGVSLCTRLLQLRRSFRRGYLSEWGVEQLFIREGKVLIYVQTSVVLVVCWFKWHVWGLWRRVWDFLSCSGLNADSSCLRLDDTKMQILIWTIFQLFYLVVKWRWKLLLRI